MSTNLEAALPGAWQLVSFVTRDLVTGLDRTPLGADPVGQLVYTLDGHMAAQLARSDMTEYTAYAGGFTVDEPASTVCHHVTMATMSELLDRPQVRRAAVEGELLTLSVTLTDADGIANESTLVWQRAATART